MKRLLLCLAALGISLAASTSIQATQVPPAQPPTCQYACCPSGIYTTPCTYRGRNMTCGDFYEQAFCV
ncbi:MAG TPA: hypothetical protein VGS07_00255 [Thermoanaerobaculia bacterium]|jgi:hypothetical protein|nr:hypothetical protein [Thermoanaerobaculia bacterium]